MLSALGRVRTVAFLLSTRCSGVYVEPCAFSMDGKQYDPARISSISLKQGLVSIVGFQFLGDLLYYRRSSEFRLVFVRRGKTALQAREAP